tara:strand:- start:775 stop:2463 length:1689 start_codon:yes stop_codon:yes gene_type:complete
MDKNTFLAFFLIMLVLLFTPRYMELVAPQQQDPDQRVDSLLSQRPDQYAEKPIHNKTKALEKSRISTSQARVEKQKEILTTIKTPLYTATISSFCGGSITKMTMNNYTKEIVDENNNIIDTVLVDIIKFDRDHPNLAVTITDLDGVALETTGPWALEREPSFETINETTSLVYKKEVFPNQFIYKELIFDPTNYSIIINLDLLSINNKIFRDVGIGWYGGLATTEKNDKDDQTYFKSYVFQGEELEDLKIGTSDKKEEKLFNGSTDWVATRTKYFTSALIPINRSLVSGAKLAGRKNNIETYDASLTFNGDLENSFLLYLGPLEYDRISELGVGLESIMDFGWSFIRPISKGVLYSLKAIHNYIPNYGFVLIVFSFLVKILVYPLTKKSYQSTTAMQAIQPEITALKEKYKSNPQKLNQATMALYKEKGVNPLGGCLPMLLQMPLLFALFVVFRTTIELRAEPFIWWIKDLSAPDIIIMLPFEIPIYGGHVAALPIFMVISMFIQQKMMSPGPQQPQQKTMQYFMTGFFFLIFNSFPSGLNLYYTLFNILTIAQQKLLPSDS